jgi:hypothetical protein
MVSTFVAETRTYVLTTMQGPNACAAAVDAGSRFPSAAARNHINISPASWASHPLLGGTVAVRTLVNSELRTVGYAIRRVEPSLLIVPLSE